MPELPDIEAYLAALRQRILHRKLDRLLVPAPFLLRTVDPAPEEAEGHVVTSLRRLGKRIVIGLSRDETAAPDDLFLIFHLMIAGRFLWKELGVKPPARTTLATLGFPPGTLALTEAGTKRRASLHIVRGEPALSAHHPGGLELLDGATTPAVLLAALARENRTLKRALTDPRTVSGVGNAYSDEILHAARLSPVLLTSRATPAQSVALLDAARRVLAHWTDLLSARFTRRFPGPGEVTAFRRKFAVHGRFKQPCPVCRAPVQRIVRAENEINYCPGCQTGGKILADHSLSRLLGEDRPRTLDDLEGS